MLIFLVLKENYNSRFRATLLKILQTTHEELEVKINNEDCQYEEEYSFQIVIYLKTHEGCYDLQKMLLKYKTSIMLIELKKDFFFSYSNYETRNWTLNVKGTLIIDKYDYSTMRYNS